MLPRWVQHTAPVKKISDALEKELIIATNGQNSRMLSALMKNMLGYKLKMLNGYQGAAEAALARAREIARDLER